LVAVRDVDDGPATIESAEDEQLAIPATIRGVERAARDGFDAVIIGCFSDPGLDEARSRVRIPVIGPAESSFYVAGILGRNFGVITATESAVPLIENALRRCHAADRCSAIRPIGIPVLQVSANMDATVEAVVETGKQVVEENGVDTLILGCMSLGFLEIARRASDRLRIPVICPITAALSTAKSAIQLRFNRGPENTESSHPGPEICRDSSFTKMSVRKSAI
jgi:allantoin racemase